MRMGVHGGRLTRELNTQLCQNGDNEFDGSCLGASQHVLTKEVVHDMRQVVFSIHHIDIDPFSDQVLGNARLLQPCQLSFIIL
jgi:hypothetical protein